MPIDFPLNSAGKRSTTDTAKAVLSASVVGVDADSAASVLAEKDWRWQYYKHFFKNTLVSGTTPSACVTIAKEGLAEAYKQFRYVDDANGDARPLHETMAEVTITSPSFGSGIVRGKLPCKQPTLQVPYKGKLLEGSELSAQCTKWREAGVMEPSADTALQSLATDDSKQPWVNLSGRHFVILGAGSQMGPTETLLKLGATVHAIDIPGRPLLWKKLLAKVINTCGTLIFPIVSAESGTERVFESETELEEASQLAGVNALEQPKELAAWVSTQAPGMPITIGCYTYLDGADFVRVAMACDAVEATACRLRPAAEVSLAFLNSPTECFLMPPEAQEMASARWQGRYSIWEQPLSTLTSGRYLERNQATAATEGGVLVQDYFVWTQGRRR
jgi:hypothetical protein